MYQSLTVKLCPTYIQRDPASPHDQWSEEDSCSADDDLKDPAEDSDSESGNSSDNFGNWSPHRTPFSGHDNRPPLKAQLSNTERDRGNKTREEGRGGEKPDSCVPSHLVTVIKYT